MTKRVFITGATGFVGSNLIRKLIEENYEVHILTRALAAPWRIKDILPKLKVHQGDLRKFKELEKIIRLIKPAGIFHLAVSNIFSGITASNKDVILDNLLGTTNLIEAAADIDYDFFINTGSFLEYGVKSRPIKESDSSEPPEIYSITKLAAEHYARSVAKLRNKPIVTLRLFTPFGPSMQPGRLVYEIITKALKNEDISLTSPAVSRDLIYIKDIMDIYLIVASRAKDFPGETFNAGSGKLTTIGGLVNLVIKETSSTSAVKWGSHHGASYDSAMCVADMTKTYANLAWHPKYSLEKGIKETIEWYINHL